MARERPRAVPSSRYEVLTNETTRVGTSTSRITSISVTSFAAGLARPGWDAHGSGTIGLTRRAPVSFAAFSQLTVMVLTKPRLEDRLKALMHPYRLRALDAFAERPGRVGTPTEIADEIGVALQNLAYHIRALERFGWLELVEKREGKRGVLERVYCAIDLPEYDSETFAALPPAERRMILDHGIALLMADIAKASDAGTLGSRPDVHFSRTPLMVDDRGWDELVAGVTQLYEDTQSIIAEAFNRVARGETADGVLTPARQTLLLFEAAPRRVPPNARTEAPEPPGEDFPKVPPAPKLGRSFQLLTHPLRVDAFHIFAETPGLVATAGDVARELGVRVEYLKYHLNALVRHGWLERADETRWEPGPGRRTYRAVEVASLYDYETWSALPLSQRNFVTEHIVGRIIVDIAVAARAGTLDARPDFHLSRKPLMLDEHGWQELAAKMTALMEEAPRIAARSAERRDAGATNPGEMISARLAMQLFEAAPRQGS